ncbi:hypothetical protein H4W34_002334 [Actinomadura algeriensis]|uniref:Uncharacterized protein n=1 Tax=Actinomadura algeriensis TaxID=1679523 RepID=A0ABR9JQ43_9ACTN|nr:hypothetical protein [Actinomadura algeriensis]
MSGNLGNFPYIDKITQTLRNRIVADSDVLRSCGGFQMSD